MNVPSPPVRLPAADSAAGCPAARNSEGGGDRLWGVSAGVFGMMLVWSLLDPVDATSVFQGEALAQNLGWLVVALLTSVASVRCGVGSAVRTLGLAVAAVPRMVASGYGAGGEQQQSAGWLAWILASNCIGGLLSFGPHVVGRCSLAADGGSDFTDWLCGVGGAGAASGFCRVSREAKRAIWQILKG